MLGPADDYGPAPAAASCRRLATPPKPDQTSQIEVTSVATVAGSVRGGVARPRNKRGKHHEEIHRELPQEIRREQATLVGGLGGGQPPGRRLWGR